MSRRNKWLPQDRRRRNRGNNIGYGMKDYPARSGAQSKPDISMASSLDASSLSTMVTALTFFVVPLRATVGTWWTADLRGLRGPRDR